MSSGDEFSVMSQDLHFPIFPPKSVLPFIILISINDTIIHQISQREIYILSRLLILP